MNRRVVVLVVSVAVMAIFGFCALALAKDDSAKKRKLRAELEGFQEVPAVSTTASGEFRGEINDNGTSIQYELSYSDLQGTVRQASIHFAQGDVIGGISVFLCQTVTNPDPTLLAPTCPQSGTVTGTITAANVIATVPTQGIAAGELAKLVQAIREGVTYVNVHSSLFPGGEIRGQINEQGRH